MEVDTSRSSLTSRAFLTIWALRKMAETSVVWELEWESDGGSFLKRAHLCFHLKSGMGILYPTLVFQEGFSKSNS